MGGLAWLGVIAVILWYYSKAPIPRSLLWLSAVYPVLYVAASVYLDRRLREEDVESR